MVTRSSDPIVTEEPDMSVTLVRRFLPLSTVTSHGALFKIRASMHQAGTPDWLVSVM